MLILYDDYISLYPHKVDYSTNRLIKSIVSWKVHYIMCDIPIGFTNGVGLNIINHI
jgi:hypothetical protein